MRQRTDRFRGFLAGAALAGLETLGSEGVVERIHGEFVFADIHAHPSRFHRANLPRIEPEEIARYRRGLIDVVVSNISTDAIYSGGYDERDGASVEPRQHRPRPGEPFAFTLDRLERIRKTIEDGDAVLAESPATVAAARREGRLSLLPALEGGDGLEGKLSNLRELHRRGLRLLQLVHFRANELGHIQTYPYSPGGLTPFGREAVAEANRLGILVDLAHANTETIMDALSISKDPLLVSHTGAKALHPGDRYLTDEEIRAIAAKGGLIGIWPNGQDLPALSDVVRHIDHVKSLVGMEHLAIGSDLRGMGSYSAGFGEEADFRAIAEALLARGYSHREVGLIMGGNFFRIWQEVSR